MSNAPMKEICPSCKSKIYFQHGVALKNYGVGTCFTPSMKAKLVSCLKCPKCGFSKMEKVI